MLFRSPTHQAIEDIAIMRALPNMTVTAVSDAEEMKRLMRATLSWPHPIYIRLAKGGASRDELISGCGLSINEAELVHRLHAPQTKSSARKPARPAPQAA